MVIHRSAIVVAGLGAFIAWGGQSSPAMAWEPGAASATGDAAGTETLETLDEAQEPAEEEGESEGEGEVYEGDFCGGGGSPVDEAWQLMRNGQLREAERSVRGAMRRGEIEGWAQSEAASVLAEIALRRGRAGAAVALYRRAIRLDSEDAGLGSRVGLALALYRNGQTHAALAQARTVATECDADLHADEVACYGAYHLLGRASPDADEMLVAMHAELGLEDGASDWDAQELSELRVRIDAGHATRRTRRVTAAAAVADAGADAGAVPVAVAVAVTDAATVAAAGAGAGAVPAAALAMAH